MSIERQIENLREEISVMARNAEAIYDKALSALHTRDESIIASVREMDSHLDHLEIQMDLKSMRILALNEPYAIDLRYVFSVIKTTRDLERIGDESKTIAKWVSRLPADLPNDIVELGNRARDAVRVAVEALIYSDINKAETVLDLEFIVDEIEDRIIQSEPDLPLALIARAMERIGDSATNIAENVIFSVKAEDIRHGSYEGNEP